MGALGIILVAIVTIAVSIVASSFGVPPVWAAALGNIAGQATGNIIGTQSGFSFKSFAISVLTAGITQGVLGPEGAPTGLGANLRSALGAGSYAEIAARAVVGNVVSQGVGNLTGAQKGFSWSSVAISAVGATAGAYASDKLGLNIRNLSPGQDLGRAAVTSAAQGLASSVASQLTQITLDGKGKLNWASVATSGISAGVGAWAGYNDPKDGGNVQAKAPLSFRDRIVADNSNFAGTRTEELTPSEKILLDEVRVTARRLTPAERALEDAKTLATETADRIMRFNSGQQFVDYAAEKVRSATGSDLAGFATYNLGNGIRIALNAPRSGCRCVKVWI